MTMPARRPTPTLVIGAGPTGLAIAAALARRGLTYAHIDQATDIGHSWRHHYERLHLHTARKHSHLPGLPMPAGWPVFPSRAQVVTYLEAYAAHFGLAPELGVKVVRAAYQGGAWDVDTEPGPGFRAERLVVATGYNAVPKRVSWPGLDTFRGEVRHASEYLSGAMWSGKSVLVVGSGNSGAEIAIDLWEHGAKPSMSIRGPVHVVPRALFGMPTQHMSIALSHLPARVADRLSLPLTKRLIGDLSAYGIRRPTLGPLEMLEAQGRVPMVDVGTVALIKQGAIRVFPDIAQFGPSTVQFTDGRTLELGAVLLATGYGAGLGRFLVGADEVLDRRGLPRVHGREVRASGIAGLYFAGFRNPTTGALRESGLEAERIAQAIAKRHREPARG